MKKSFLFGITLCSAVALNLQASEQPVIVDGFYAYYLSSNGKWLGSEAGTAAILNMETGKVTYYNDASLGLGNCVADNGDAVGDRTGVGVVMSQGIAVTPEPLRTYRESFINCITPDGSKISGFVMNPNVSSMVDENAIAYIPFYCERDENGKWSDLVLLPHPEKDFFGYTPQYITTLSISEDGNTIVGQVTDSFGRMTYPVVFQKDEDNNWDYSTPSESLFNPNKIVLPPNPWSAMPEAPEYADYMSPEMLELYEEDLWLWSINDPSNPLTPLEEPNPIDYMTSAEKEKYIAALNEYKDYYYDHIEEFEAYDEKYYEIMISSAKFGLNDLVMDLSGNFIVSPAISEDENGDDIAKTYIFNIAEKTFTSFDSKFRNVLPIQILSDGTIVGATPMMDVPTSFLLFPGTEDYIPFNDYLADTNPACHDWINKTIPNGTGRVSVNDDLTLFAGGLTPNQYAKEPVYFYTTYLIGENLPEISGVDKIINEDDGYYRVYNLQGMNILTTTDKSEISNLPSGLYIINGKKVAIRK